MRLFKDENNHYITENMLRDEFALLKLVDPATYDYSFEDYIRNCTDKNGALKELKYVKRRKPKCPISLKNSTSPKLKTDAEN